MIISASRRTDLPAFYSEWFMNRIREGFFVRINPFNTKQKKLISLLPKDVDIIVFWSKNPSPILKHLDELDSMGYHYYFQFTINNYPFIYEPNVPNVKKNIETFKKLSERLGKEKVIWRYDPIILSNRTSIDFHIENINFLADKLKNYTTKCVFSFLDMYGKVENRIKKLYENHGLATRDICQPENEGELFTLINALKIMSEKTGLKVSSCAEKINLDYYGIEHNSCIDGDLVNKILNTNIKFKKDTSQRKECLCAESVDVGMYNTCLHKCSYCYANYSDKVIEKNVRIHIKDSPIMLGDFKLDDDELYEFKRKSKDITLF